MDKYEAMRGFIKENFITTDNDKDRLHTETIINILRNNNFIYDPFVMAKVFKSVNIGKYREFCVINHKRRAGYYNIIYKEKS
jgi:hypothetical protein